MQNQQNETRAKGLQKDPVIEPDLFFDSKITKRKWPWALIVTAAVIIGAATFFFLGTDRGIDAEGIVKAKRLVKVGATQPGVLKEVMYKKGDSVKEGEVIARLRNADFDRELEESKLTLQILKQDRQLIQNKIHYLGNKIQEKQLLFENGVIGKAPLEGVQFEISQANETKAIKEKQIEAIQKKTLFLDEKLKTLEIKAPFSGVILEDPNVRAGNLIAVEENLFELADPNSFYIETAIPESQVNKISEGDTAQIQFEAFKGQLMNGQITKMGVRAEKEVEKVFKVKHIVSCEIKLDKIPDRLKYGMIAKIKIHPRKQRSGSFFQGDFNGRISKLSGKGLK